MFIKLWGPEKSEWQMIYTFGGIIVSMVLYILDLTMFPEIHIETILVVV